MTILFRKQKEILNVLVDDGTSIGPYTLDMMPPPRGNLRRLLICPRWNRIVSCIICALKIQADLGRCRGRRVRHRNIRSTMVLAKVERVISTSSMNVSDLFEKTRIELCTYHSWFLLKTNLMYDDLIELRDVF